MKGIIQRVRGTRRGTWLVLPAVLALLAMATVREAQPVEALQQGNITVQKELVGPDGTTPVTGNLAGYVFTISGGGTTSPLPATNAQGTTSISVAAGTYTITEAAQPGSTLLNFRLAGTTTPIANFSVPSGGTASLVARNQVAGTASISIVKQIVDANNAVIATADRSGFQFTIVGPSSFTSTVTTDANGNATASNLGGGTYTITEQPRTGFTLSAMAINGVPANNGASFNLAAGNTAQVVAQNRQGTAGSGITITKTLVDANNNAVAGDRSGFQFTVTCGASFSMSATSDANGTATINGAPAGTCTISEATRTGFTLVDIVVSGTTTNIGNGGSFTVTAGQAVSLTVRNRSGSGAGPTEQVQLFMGCNNVASTYPNGTPASQVFANISPSGALIAGWFFINAQQRFVGYSPIPGAPNDLTSINRGDPLFICVNAASNFTRPTI